MIIIDRQEVYKMLTPERCTRLMREAFSGLASGVNTQNVRTGMGLPKGGLAFMPCYLGSRNSFGAKIISVYPGNSREGYPSHQGQVLLFDAEHGEPVALVDACAITEIRTASASAAATDLLSKKNSHSLTILGSGAQAISHLRAMLTIRPITSVSVWSFHRENAEKYTEKMQAEFPQLSFTIYDTVEEAVRYADIICSVCRSKDPLIYRSMVKEGVHINAVGTCNPVTREVSSDLVAAARLYVDQVEACHAESGEYLIPLSEGLITSDHIIGSIGDVINGTAPARRDDDEITIFDSLGLAIEDVICADELYREKAGLK